MEKRVALSIGIEHAKPLTDLPGAVEGAKDFDAWAKSQGYETHLVTDEGNKAVTVAALEDLIVKIIKESQPDRLIVYFAGHGIEPVTGAAYWLLSGWDDNSNEAVNVNLSLANAKRSAIRQIAIFADACRSTVRDAHLIGGSSIFLKKNLSVAPRSTQWDQFFAARPGASAQEVPADGALRAFGIFTRCVLRALSGTEEKAITDRPPRRVVISDTLANYIEDEVWAESARTPGAAVQPAEAIPGWRMPDDVYVETEPSLEDKKKRQGLGKDKGFAQVMVERATSAFANRKVARAKRLEDRAVDEKAARYNAEYRAHPFGRPRSEFQKEPVPWQQGLIFVGCEPVFFAVRKDERADLVWGGSMASIVAFGERPLSILIELKDGNWIGSCTLPGFVGTVLAESGRVASVNYAPAPGSAEQWIYAETVPVLSRWTAFSQQGRVGDYAELRKFDKINPSLGIIAAYAYERIGDLTAINDIADRMVGHPNMPHAVPFDVALLSTRPIRRSQSGLTVKTETGERPVAGSFPLMTRGWSFLDREDDFVSGALFELRKGLLPALWTTFRREEGKRMAELLSQGEI